MAIYIDILSRNIFYNSSFLSVNIDIIINNEQTTGVEFQNLHIIITVINKNNIFLYCEYQKLNLNMQATLGKPVFKLKLSFNCRLIPIVVISTPVFYVKTAGIQAEVESQLSVDTFIIPDLRVVSVPECLKRLELAVPDPAILVLNCYKMFLFQCVFVTSEIVSLLSCLFTQISAQMSVRKFTCPQALLFSKPFPLI